MNQVDAMQRGCAELKMQHQQKWNKQMSRVNQAITINICIYKIIKQAR